MRRYLLVALWPAGIAAIAAATVIAARRAPVSPALATADDLADQETGPAPAGSAASGRILSNTGSPDSIALSENTRTLC